VQVLRINAVLLKEDVKKELMTRKAFSGGRVVVE